MFILLISNHTVFLVQFEINLHLWVIQKAEIARAASASAISAFWITHPCKLIPNWTRNLMITYTNKHQAQHLFWINVRTYDFDIRFWHKILSRQSFGFTVEQPNVGQFSSIICGKMCILWKANLCLFLTKFFLFSEWISFWKLFHWIHAIAEVLSNRFRSVGFDLFDWV